MQGVKISVSGRVRIIAVSCEDVLDRSRNELLELILGNKYVVLDLSCLSHARGEDLGFLLSAKKAHREQWGTHMHIFKIVAGPGKVRRSIEEMRMEHVIPTYRTLQEALAVIPHKRVLHVEPDDEFAQAIEILLETNGFEVVRIKTPNDLLIKAEGQFDLCITEMEFEGCEDLDILRRLRLEYGCPVAAVTACLLEEAHGAAFIMKKPVVISQFMKNITEALEQPLHEYYETIFDGILSPLAVFSSNGAVLRVNSAWRELFHVMKTEIGADFSAVFSDDLEKDMRVDRNLILENVLAVARTLEVRSVDLGGMKFRFSSVGNVRQTAHVLANVLPSAAQSSELGEDRVRDVMLSLLEDLDQTRVDLSGANVRLQELDRLKSEFVSAVTHELRTPMTAIKGAAENILDDLHGTMPPDQEKAVEIILRNAKRLARLIENLLDRSKIEAGTFAIVPRACDIKEPIRTAMEDLHVVIARTGIRCVIDMSDEPVNVECDPERMVQVMINLLDNAIRFAANEVRLSLKAGKETVTLMVEDDGPGVPEPERERIFERFTNIRGYTQSRTGLGLSIVRSIVETQGGEIWVEQSDVLSGARFVVSLPVEASPAAPGGPSLRMGTPPNDVRAVHGLS